MAYLGGRPLEVREAYEALEQFAADYGRAPLLLLMHAAVPETLRADLLHLIRQNFLPAATCLSVEADVLFSPLSHALGNGYYRIDPQVRWHCLGLLRSLHRHDPRPRTERVAELLWLYVEQMERQAARSADPQLADYLAIQRWVALAYLEPASAAEAFADALKRACEHPSALLRLGGVTAAIELPLAGEQTLIAYARSLDALLRGDEQHARELADALGDRPIRVGEVTLRSPRELLAGLRPGQREAAQPAAPESSQPALRGGPCVLVGPSVRGRAVRVRSDIEDGYELLERCVTSALGLQVEREPDPYRGQSEVPAQTYHKLLAADLVICDLSIDDPVVWYLLGVCWALRPAGTLVVSGRRIASPYNVFSPPAHIEYVDTDFETRRREESRICRELVSQVSRSEPSPLRSPLYDTGSTFRPPTRAAVDAASVAKHWLAQLPERTRRLCVVVQELGRREEPSYAARKSAHDVAYQAIARVTSELKWEVTRLWEFGSEGDSGETRAYELLRDAGLVIIDLRGVASHAQLRLGACLVLRPCCTLVIVEELRLHEAEFWPASVLTVSPDAGESELDSEASFAYAITSAILGGDVESPVYRAIPSLEPPRRAQPSLPSSRREVFVSYGHQETALARVIVERLRAHGVAVHWDRDPRVTGDPESKLSAWLANADALLVIADRFILDSRFRLAEVARATKLEKRIIPVMLDGDLDVPALKALPWTNLGSDGYLPLSRLQGEAFEQALTLTVRNILMALGVDTLDGSATHGHRPDEPSDRGRSSAPVARGNTLVVETIDDYTLQFQLTGTQELARRRLRLGSLQELREQTIPELLRDSPGRTRRLAHLVRTLLPSELRQLAFSDVPFRLVVDPRVAPIPWELLFAHRGARLGPPTLVRLPARELEWTLAGSASRSARLIGLRASKRLEAVLLAHDFHIERAQGGERVGPSEPQLLIVGAEEPRVMLTYDGQPSIAYFDGDEAVLSLSDLERVQQVPELIVLAGRMPYHSGELLYDLVAALLGNGVRCVVALAWPIAQAEIEEFLERLLAALLGGEPLSRALSRTRLACIEQFPDLTSWAAFQVWGDPDFELTLEAKK